MSTQPTPTELKALWQLHAADIGGIFHYAHAVLAKWGTPAVAAEPVARLVIGKTKGGVSLTHMVVPAAYQLQEGTYALYTAPQPVAREPLSAAQKQHIHNETGDWENKRWRFAHSHSRASGLSAPRRHVCALQGTPARSAGAADG